MTHRLPLTTLLLAATAVTVRAQQPATAATSAVPTARAVRATVSPRLDGRDDDAVWATAPVTDDFRQFAPGEAQPARYRTAFRVAYDDRTLFVFVRAYDPRPDSIVALLSRRDARTPSEWIKVVIDGYRDRRTGLQFIVNPAGVKRDASIYSDVVEDIAWDGVWDVATRVDDEGWTAEFAIPFSQIRFNPGDTQVFGFGVWRDVGRHSERDAWPTYRPSHQTFASQLGDLVGIEGIERARRLEVMPYAVTKNVSLPEGTAFRNEQQFSGGLDLRAGLTSNVTLDATLNPDFGQVEADPAIINLSAFEVRFEERRPFFQEGVSLFRCQGPCEGIFYTRRLGRTPQLRSDDRDPLSSAIQGAAKLTGRFANGTQFGVVAARTAKETGQAGQTIEPASTALVGRLVRDFRGGRSQFGTMVTALVRDLDDDTEALLRRDAYTVLFQGYHRFAGRWEASGYTGHSVARGTEEAIANTQLTSVHYHQRPDHGEARFDPTRTSLSGSVSSASLRRYAGRVRWETTTRYATPNTELNDLGFVTLINDVMLRNQVSFSTLVPRGPYRRLNGVLNAEQHWTTGGLPTGASTLVHGSAEFANFWSSYFSWNASQLGGSHCVSCTRGGPALRLSPRHSMFVGVDGDPRRALVPFAEVGGARGDEGRSWTRFGNAGVTARAGARTSMTLSANYERRTDDAQWLRNFGDALSDTTHYAVTRLAQHIFGMTLRTNVTLTPRLSLELYAQPFIATGERSRLREVTDARARDYDARFADFAPAGFTLSDYNSRQFNSNAVLRWEYRPGSVIFLVWQQGRTGFAADGRFSASRDLGALFGERPNNTLLLKASYWFNP